MYKFLIKISVSQYKSSNGILMFVLQNLANFIIYINSLLHRGILSQEQKCMYVYETYYFTVDIFCIKILNIIRIFYIVQNRIVYKK